MARFLAAIGLTIAGAMPFPAFALTLGEINLQSALNQPFNAEIPVASQTPADFDNLQVEIADIATFEQFGLDRPAFLSGFNFEVVPVGSGAAVRITSAQPVVEPFVTILLEVSWPQGRLLREFTVLLDPPVFATEAVATAVSAPAAQPLAAPPAEPATASRTSAAPQPEMTGKSATMPATERVPDTAPQPRAAAAPQAQPAMQDGGVYGPVRRNDTLWNIAGDMIGDSDQISRNQMMMAIYQANPEAFSGNINRLKAGMILRVPANADIALNKSAANAAVRDQNAEWRAGAAPAQQQGGRLKLVPPPETGSEAADPATQSMQASSTAAGATVSADAAELEGRVQQLEADLTESRRQIQIRDQELEALQRQLAQISSADLGVEEQLAEQETVTEELAAENLDLDEVIAEDATESLDSGLLPDETAAESAAKPSPADVTPAPVVRTSDDSSAGGLLTNPLVYISLVVVLLLAWLIARNRSKAAEEDTGRWDALDDDTPDEVMEKTMQLKTKPPEDSAFVVEEGASAPSEEANEDDLISPFADDSSEDWAGLADESETPLERTISTDSAVNLDQADPIAESDFHMAYGLYDQAADLLTKAIEDEPERKDLRMKLLEVFFIWENQDGFMRTAEALQQQFGDTPDTDWNKVLIMGKQICPDDPLFADSQMASGATENVDLEFSEDGGDGDAGSLDLAFGEENEASLDLDFDSDASGMDLDLTGQSDQDADSGTGGLDFDIGSEDEVTQVAGDDMADFSSESPTMETPTIESEALESTMETPTIETEALESTMETPTIESPALDNTVETPTIESPIGDWDDSGENASDQTAEINLDDLDLDLTGLDEIDAETFAEDADDSDEGESSLAGLEEDADKYGDETREQRTLSIDPDDAPPSLDELAAGGDGDVDSTAEMPGMDDSESGGTVEQPGIAGSGDTVEQPQASVGETAEQPGLSAGAAAEDMIDVGQMLSDDAPTGTLTGASGEDGATMTEVGTKLDLARAYIDMGDPDGARSILNEVLDEADGEQKQEAQKLLDDLVD